MYYLLYFSLKLLSILPLSALRFIGRCIGLYEFHNAKRANKRIRHNLLLTGLATTDNIDSITKEVFRQFDSTIIEAACIAWSNPSERYLQKLVLKTRGEEELRSAMRYDKTPTIILFPHLSNVEIAAHFMQRSFKKEFEQAKRTVSILYKPLKSKLFNRYILSGRGDYINYVPTTRSGVINLLKQFKLNGIVALSPDHVASQGDGTWVDFFGHKVFATTLAAKLIKYAKGNVFFLFPKSVRGGFEIDYVKYHQTTDDINGIVQSIYAQLEERIKLYPTQYFWNYDIFRVPDRLQASAKV